eukprot:GHVR01060789.1.p1 GENE.GHVR01060789.1~~GHVR01060789.1.p1  ORF type:complete len:179 (-),score=23.88 GHVR01060789.1:408-944(-)
MKMRAVEVTAEVKEATGERPSTQISQRKRNRAAVPFCSRNFVADRKNSQTGKLYIIPCKRTIRKPSTACQTSDETPLPINIHAKCEPAQIGGVYINSDVCDVMQVDKTAGADAGVLYEPPAATHTHAHVTLEHPPIHACDACQSASDTHFLLSLYLYPAYLYYRLTVVNPDRAENDLD